MLFQPFWLILLLPAAACLFKWRFSSRTLSMLRAAGILLIILGMCRPALKLPSRTGVVVVIADRSKSMPAEGLVLQKEVVERVRSGIKKDDLMAVVSFGQGAVVERPPQKGEFAGFVNDIGEDQSNLAEGIELALSLIPKESPGRMLLLSDGKWTGTDPKRPAARAAGRAVAIDYRRYSRPQTKDLAVLQLTAPETVRPGESFLLKAQIHAPSGQTVKYALHRDKTVISEGTKTLSPGKTFFLFRDRADEPGTHEYALHVTGREKDPVPENNHASVLSGVRGPRPVLFVSETGTSGLAGLLEKGGIRIRNISARECRWSVAELSRYSALIIENVPADRIGPAGMEIIAAWVQEAGAGMMMTGGKNAYGPGGYFRSPLEPVMPVSMELRQEHRKLALAIVVALDRSGSMAADAGDGRTKMDLANLGAVQVLDLLSPIDEFGVIAVDTTPHPIVTLKPVEESRAARGDILRIGSEGGGIFVCQALTAAARMLQDATAQTRHIILFADASDAEEPGKYRELLEKCAKANITVSVIGLGYPDDSDAKLLEDVAFRGNGRCFFTSYPWEIPRLFAQDTFTVVRSAFLEGAVSVKSMPAFAGITGRIFRDIPDIGGYNLCYIRPDAGLAVMTQDEYKAPVLASWRAGKGRVICYTGEADGAFTGPIAGWDRAGDFFTSMARWICGPESRLPEDMLVTQMLNKGILTVELELDPERGKDIMTMTPRLGILRGVPGKKPRSESVLMKWTSPDTLTAEIVLSGRETVLPILEIPGTDPVTLSPSCLPYSPEFTPSHRDSGQRMLQEIGEISGGKERADLAGIWDDLPEKPRYTEIGHWLTLSAIIIFLLEILHRRTGMLAVNLRKRIRKGRKTEERAAGEKPLKKKKAKAEKKSLKEKQVSEAVREESVSEPEPDNNEVWEAMQRAKQKARKRMER